MKAILNFGLGWLFCCGGCGGCVLWFLVSAQVFGLARVGLRPALNSMTTIELQVKKLHR